MNEQYEMPIPEIGDLVWWFPTANKHEEPSGAYVTHVGERTLALSVVVKDIPTLYCVDGVRHINDPALLKIKEVPHGAWDLKPRNKFKTPVQAEPIKKAG